MRETSQYIVRKASRLRYEQRAGTVEGKKGSLGCRGKEISLSYGWNDRQTDGSVLVIGRVGCEKCGWEVGDQEYSYL